MGVGSEGAVVMGLAQGASRPSLRPLLGRAIRRLAAITALAALALIVTAASASAAVTFELSWGNSDPLDNAIGAGTDAAGNLYVADNGNSRIVKYSPSGTVLAKFDGGTGGTYPGISPSDVAVDSAGNMFVASGIRVVKLGPTGTFIKEWGPYGGPVDPYNYNFGPIAIEIDSTGNVYVGDCATPSHRIQKFDANGNFLLEWGSKGSNNSQFQCPTGLGIDSQDNVYVADNGNDRVQKFDNQGTLLAKWGQAGSTDGRFEGPTGITVDASDNVYVADGYNSRIQEFSAAGTFIRKWGSQGTGAGQFISVSDIAAGPGGVLYAVDKGDRVQKFDSTGTYLAGWGALVPGDGQFDTPLGIAVAPDGTVYVSDTNRDRIQRFDSTGTFLGKWGSSGSGNGQFAKPTGITVAASGNVYVIDSGNSRVQEFSPSGGFIREWGSFGSGPGEFLFSDPSSGKLEGLDTDSAGNVYVATDGNRIQKFGPDGTFLTEWGSYGGSDGQFTGPAGVAVDSQDNVYVTSLANRFDVQKFDSEGNFLTKWGAEGSSDGQFGLPTGIAIDTNDHVFVADPYNSRVHKFASDGTFLEKWGEQGRGDGQFVYAPVVAAGPGGAVYVADSEIQRIQKFTVDDSVPPPPAPTSLSTDPASPGTTLTPKVIGTAEAGTKVKIYTASSCSGTPVGEGSAATFAGAGIPVNVAPGSTTTFYATATNELAGVTSSCSIDSATYTNQPNQPPAAPTITATSPASPSNSSTTPSVKGSASSDTTTVDVFTQSNCQGSSVSGSKAAFEGAGIQVSVASNSTTQLSARAKDAAGNASACSSDFAYTHDNQPPAAPTITATDPASPANDNAPKVKGTTTEASSTVKIYSNATCTGSPLNSGSAATFATPGITVAVPDNSTTVLYATATDQAGNTSACSSPVTYVEVTPPSPLAPPPDQGGGSGASDTTPPDTTITGGPKAKTKSKSATFTFTSTEAGSTFECKLDSGSFQSCSSPFNVKVKKGKHSFEVRAKDAEGNVDPTPAARSWKVKKKKKK